tara:strand:- start:129 stop:437 length:309 start_codon:yes stop_codon:yes gene_type:complete
MKFAILFYAVFTLVGSVDKKEVISWGLTFPSHEKCIEFYDQNSKKLLDGVKEHAYKEYNQPMHLTELGCAHAVSDFDLVLPDGEERNAIITMRVPLYTGSSI